MTDATAPARPTRAELHELAVKVVGLLDGLAVGDALDVLGFHARSLVLDGSTLDASTPRFAATAAEARRRCEPVSAGS